MTDINDNFWRNLTATVLSRAVAIGMCKAVPKLLDGIVSGKPMTESSSGGKAADRLGYYSVSMSIPDAVVNLHGMVCLGLMADGNTVKNASVEKNLWLADTDADDDVTVLDLTDELEHSSIDLDNGSQVRFATSDRFDEIGIRDGAKAFAVCGNPEQESFTPKAGWYVGKVKPSHSKSDLYVFHLEGVPGDSGSPMFVLENGITYLVGIFSCGMPPENKYVGVVSLDNLMKLLGGKGVPYFGAAEE